jgi:hypothetical protein
MYGHCIACSCRGNHCLQSPCVNCRVPLVIWKHEFFLATHQATNIFNVLCVLMCIDGVFGLTLFNLVLQTFWWFIVFPAFNYLQWFQIQQLCLRLSTDKAFKSQKTIFLPQELQSRHHSTITHLHSEVLQGSEK